MNAVTLAAPAPPHQDTWLVVIASWNLLLRSLRSSLATSNDLLPWGCQAVYQRLEPCELHADLWNEISPLLQANRFSYTVRMGSWERQPPERERSRLAPTSAQHHLCGTWSIDFDEGHASHRHEAGTEWAMWQGELFRKSDLGIWMLWFNFCLLPLYLVWGKWGLRKECLCPRKVKEIPWGSSTKRLKENGASSVYWSIS